ncbi:MAG: OmpA family protein, partial [Pseudomonadota bacterium]
DAAGTAGYNQRLSQQRADAVRALMIESCGLAPDRLVAAGFGESSPLPGIDPFAAENRRVEFWALRPSG